MRVLSTALTLAGTVSALLVGVASPAAASHQCQPDDQHCYITDETTIPVGTPAFGPQGAGPYVVRGPDLCNGSDCTETYVLLPGAYVSSTGGTLIDIHLPEYGLRVDATGQSQVYYGVPTWTGHKPPVGASLVVHVPVPPARTGSMICDPMVPIGIGPLSVSGGSDCYITVAVTV